MRLIQISAWNDSGGGFMHRLLDGHPALKSWPFELLLGRDNLAVDDFGEDWFRGRFRWPRQANAASAGDGEALFDSFSDAELKGALRDPQGAKHRDFPISVALDVWRHDTVGRWKADGRMTQGSFIESYIETFFELLEGADGDQTVLGHCPVAILDASETWADVPDTQFVCVIRSPLSGFADMSLRHPGLDAARYAAKWSLINGASVLWAGKVPERVRLVIFSELLRDREATMRALCKWLGLAFDPIVTTPTWRGRLLQESAMGPFGGVPAISSKREIDLAASLHAAVRDTLTVGTAAVASLIGI